MNIYELYGRLAEKYEAECAAHRQTVGVLSALKDGMLRLDQLDVNANSGSWTMHPGREQQKPQTDPT